MHLATSSWQLWFLLAAADTVAILLLRLPSVSRRLLPVDRVAYIALLIGVNVTMLFSALLVDRSQCGPSPSIACLLNTNRGTWTFGALCVAAATLYVNSRMKQADEHAAEGRRRGAVLLGMSAAIDELVHNLQHFAHQVADDCSFHSFPATTFEATFALLSPDVAAFCAPDVLSRVRHLQRVTNHNRALLRSAGEMDRSLKLIALIDEAGIVKLPRDEWLAKASSPAPSPGAGSGGLDEPSTSPLAAVRCDERVITHSVRGFMELALHHRHSAHVVLDAPEFKWLRRFADRGPERWCYYPKSSDLDGAEEAALRNDGVSLYCWIKDREIEGVEVIPVRVAFRDLAHRPH